MYTIIAFTLGNFGLIMLLLAICIILLNRQSNKSIPLAELSFRWLTLLPLGMTAIYAFIMHAFFPEFTAKTIGWTNNPFQYEVAMANLGFGVMAILAFTASYGFRLATVIGNTCWLWGDATGHVYQMLVNHNFAIGNAGSWFWLDVLMPLLLIICLAGLGKKDQAE